MGDRTPPPPKDFKTHGPNDKQSEAGAGGITAQEFRQNHSSQRLHMPHELTAEWTVKAQLRFARSGETVRKEFSTNDPVNPVRVVYKWSAVDASTTAEGAQNEEDKSSGIFKRNSSRTSANSHEPPKRKTRRDFQKQESFRSTASSMTCGGFGGGDSAFSGSNNSNKRQQPSSADNDKNTSATDFYGTRCRSTCNIIVSAVADFLSPLETSMEQVENPNFTSSCNFIPEEETDPIVFNTTANYTVLPEKSFDEVSYPETSYVSKKFDYLGKLLNLRDAFCQTSDTETKYFDELHRKRFSRSPLDRRDSRRSYDYRRATADVLFQHPGYGGRVNEGNSFMPSREPTPTQTFKSSSMPRISSLGGGETGVGESSLPAFMASARPTGSTTEPQKKPRTVHIDVYCTGSEDDQADGESSSDSDVEDKKHDQESNSTFQTVFENEQMRLRHQRIYGQALPRRLGDHKQPQTLPQIISKLPTQPSDESAELLLGHAITKSSTAEEVHESKQLLFRKHVGDQRAVKLQNLRQKYLRQSSDDALSLGYPNSSRSTIRDNTCSSVSSILAGHDLLDSSWKETDEPEEYSYSLAKSDSFEYENALDRLRIRQMERLWSRSNSNEDESKSHVQPGSSYLQTISEVAASKRNSPLPSGFQRHDTLPSDSEIYSETDQYNAYRTQHAIQTSPIPTTLDTATADEFQQTSHFPRNRPGFMQFFGPHSTEHDIQKPGETLLAHQTLLAPVQSNSEPSLLSPNYQAGLQRWKSEARSNLSASGTPAITPMNLSRQTSPQPSATYSTNFQRSGSEDPLNTSSANTFPINTPTPARRFDMYHRPSPAVSEASNQPPPSGYSSEYLNKARKFGKVVAVRKPGHHVGPTKNPNCSCESCQRWLTERFQIRARAFSLGDSPILKRPS